MHQLALFMQFNAIYQLFGTITKNTKRNYQLFGTKNKKGFQQ